VFYFGLKRHGYKKEHKDKFFIFGNLKGWKAKKIAKKYQKGGF